MTYQDVLEALAASRGAAPAVAGPGLLSRLLWATERAHASLYQMELGYPTAVALGLALAMPGERVVAVEGDGSMLAGVGVLATVARYHAPNLVVLVCDNGVYGTVGAGTMESATRHGADLAALARASGWDSGKVIAVETARETADALSRAFRDPGPWCIVARVAHTPNERAGGAGQIPLDVVEGAMAFRREMLQRRAAAGPGAGGAR
ncbi:MAG TPA: thiamine pyrophosphate-dependent enzyme [bacterium]|nr:thiamine pyrophosphate-dependent enzyme [bacterium]